MVRQRLAEPAPTPRWVLLGAEPITDFDTTAAEVLADLDEELNADDVHLAFAELKDPVKETVQRYGLLETINASYPRRIASASLLAVTPNPP